MAERTEHVQRAFSAYTIERELGAGGMATVYLAHDKKHDRKVAIKILHAELAAVLGAERFLQEIRVTANLQHPHILGLIDSGIIGEDAGELRGRPYYVMPYLEGESLRQRLSNEQQLPVSDSVRIATEVASALDYAHRHNVIHRDIKPENILLHDGSAIIADFGIALAVTQAGGERITQSGMSLGTPTYMSPEQAAGERAITGRSDIYSLGAVTYEMLSGDPPFRGPTAQALVVRVMTEEPRSLTTHRRNVPQNVAAAVSRALQKIPADRFGSAHEFADALNSLSLAVSTASAAPVGRDPSNRRLRQMLTAAIGLAMIMTGVALWGWIRPPDSHPVVRSNLVFDSTEAMVEGGSSFGRLAISPDGSRLVYVGGPRAQLLMRPRNQLRVTALQGTEGAKTPFFSPDDQHIGFITGISTLKLAAFNGGPPITVTDSLVGSAGASWGPDGFVYADGFGAVSLVRVEAKAGAVPKWFTTLDTMAGETDHTWPEVLPNGKGVLFTITYGGKKGPNGRTPTAIGVADITSGKHHVLLNGGIYPRYAAAGYLLYVTTNRTLMMVPFDQNSMKVTGEPTALVEGMRFGRGGAADLAVSDAGTLVYATVAGQGRHEMVWVTRDGNAQSVDPDWKGRFWQPALSPDGKQLAVTITTLEGTGDIWTKRLDRGPSVKLTLEGTQNFFPTWTPDGRSVTYSSNAAASADLWTKRADGSTRAVLQLHEKGGAFNPRWSHDGKWLVFTRAPGSGSGEILGIRPGIDTAPLPLVATGFSPGFPTLSPDGRWLAYVSDETGQAEIYVVPFPATSAAKWAVTTRGGTAPLWSHKGSELYYLDGSGNLESAEVSTSPTFSLGTTTALFQAGGFRPIQFGLPYDVAPDDRRFLVVRPVAGTAAENLIMVENWFEELKARSPK
jgi:serine/threonine protein kinase/Tol biopolymer transport system component